MAFAVLLHDDFDLEFQTLSVDVQKAILKGVRALEIAGHHLGRPWVDILNGSAHANMKELRATVRKVEWRVAFAFDPGRQAVLLAAAAKGGKNEGRTYAKLIRIADARFSSHVASIEKDRKDGRSCP